MTCACGQPATRTLYISHRYPRAEYLPEAVDPLYVHCGGYRLLVCEDPGCEPVAFLACREQIIEDLVMRHGMMGRELTGEQLAGVELRVIPNDEDPMVLWPADADR
jgi:hypothetical protein